MHEQVVLGVVFQAEVVGDTCRHRHSRNTGIADEGIDFFLFGKKEVEEGFEVGFEAGFEVGFEEVFGRSLNFKPPELITFVKDLSTYNIYSGLKAPPVQ